jgi:hypothetical protein
VRKLTAVALAIAALIVGGLLGYVVSREFFRAKLMAYEMASIDHLSTYVMIQRFQGTREAYEASLHDLLLALDERERADPGPVSSRQIVSVDKALTYIRLALLATERSDLDTAAKYRAQAESMCPRAGWKSCSWDEMTNLVRGLDEHSMWNTSGSPSELASTEHLEQPVIRAWELRLKDVTTVASMNGVVYITRRNDRHSPRVGEGIEAGDLLQIPVNSSLTLKSSRGVITLTHKEGEWFKFVR